MLYCVMPRQTCLPPCSQATTLSLTQITQPFLPYLLAPTQPHHTHITCHSFTHLSLTHRYGHSHGMGPSGPLGLGSGSPGSSFGNGSLLHSPGRGLGSPGGSVGGRKAPRKINKTPFKVLDAPALQVRECRMDGCMDVLMDVLACERLAENVSCFFSSFVLCCIGICVIGQTLSSSLQYKAS